MGKKCDLCNSEVHEYYSCGTDNRWSLCTSCFEKTRNGLSDDSVDALLSMVTALRAKAAAGEMYANAIGRIESALGRIGNVSVDETVREVEALVMKLRLAAWVAVRGPRFTDAHMEAAANEVADELRSAMNGEGSL